MSNYIKPYLYGVSDYKEIIDLIYSSAYMENKSTPPESREGIEEDIKAKLRDMLRYDEETVCKLYNTMRGVDDYVFSESYRRYGYIFNIENDNFFDEYYQGESPSEIIEDIMADNYREETWAAVGSEPGETGTVEYMYELEDYLSLDEFAESIKQAWRRNHDVEETDEPEN